jgi:lysophospholipase L1-like esterase
MHTPKKTFLALGDSYTVGELGETSQRWTMQLIKLLEEKNIFFQPPVTIAHTGATSGELLSDLTNLKPSGKFDLVTLLIGVNNQYRGYSIDEYENEFTHLLNIAIDLAIDKSRVVVVAIPDWSYSPFAKNDKRSIAKISEEIALFNAANKKITQSLGIKYADINSASNNPHSDYFAIDGLHPSGLQYKDWVIIINKIVLEIF